MTLENIPLADRVKLTRSYPVLISAFPGSGKSTSVEMLSDEDKARTVIFDVEGKGLPDDTGDEYRSIVRLKPTVPSPGSTMTYENEGNVKYRTIVEVMQHIRGALAHKDVDRVVIDSFTALVDAFEKHYVTVSNGLTLK